MSLAYSGRAVLVDNDDCAPHPGGRGVFRKDLLCEVMLTYLIAIMVLLGSS